jgi:hypothetical protein
MYTVRKDGNPNSNNTNNSGTLMCQLMHNLSFIMSTFYYFFYYSQALIVQDGPLASLFGVS